MPYDWRKHVRSGGGRGSNRHHGGTGGGGVPYARRGGGGGGRQHHHRGGEHAGDGGRRTKMQNRQGGEPALLGTMNQLEARLRQMEGRPYPAYRDVEGAWTCLAPSSSTSANAGAAAGQQITAAAPLGTLYIDRVQSDPYAAPSKVRFRVPQQQAAFPKDAYATSDRTRALCDFVQRLLVRACKTGGHDEREGAGGGWHGKKGGEMTIDTPGQHVLARSGVICTPAFIEARFTVALPARGRSIMGTWAADILTRAIPVVMSAGLFFTKFTPSAANSMWQHIRCVEDQVALRASLTEAGLVAFVADGAILPRKSGADDRPLEQDPSTGRKAVAFVSPPTLRRSFTVPNRLQPITGMGLPVGISLIVGGGFHGKSTLLQALQVGIYDHIPGDGREFVVCVPDAVKIRAEDGRCVHSVNVSGFINNLPFSRQTGAFSTADASGSTSQAASICEAIELGATALLIDEDTSANNFMSRDRRMQALVADKSEPITPFIARARALCDFHGVSTIMVVGGNGDFFSIADTVVLMTEYCAADVSIRAKEIATAAASAIFEAPSGAAAEFVPFSSRAPHASSIHTVVKSKAFSVTKAQFGDLELDLSGLEQLVEVSQTRAIVDGIQYLAHSKIASSGGGAATAVRALDALLREIDTEMDEGGVDVLCSWRGHGWHEGRFARPRRFELGGALSRLRCVRFEQVHGGMAPHRVSGGDIIMTAAASAQNTSEGAWDE